MGQPATANEFAMPLAAQLLTLLIILSAFWIMLRPIAGGTRGRARMTGGGGGTGGRIMAGVVFSVLLPFVWWTLGILGRLYQRTFIVFAEFVTGVPDWVTYRTSGFKFGGAALGFVSFNAALLVALSVALAPAGAALPPVVVLAGLSGVAAGCGVLARTLMRRAP
jgi:hypothetical protein